MPKSSMRARRVADLIQHEIALFFKREVHDPRLLNLSISGVDVSPDLRNAKIFYTLLDKNELEHVKTALHKATGYLRALLAEKTRLRYTPHIEFIYDESAVRGQALSELISKLELPNEKPSEDK